MSIMRSSKVFRGCAAGMLVLGAAAIAGSAPVRAADDEPTFDQKIMRGIMDGLGFKRDGEAGINYQERAPLVIPSSRDLAPPEQANAANNPAWPKDPDVERRKAQAAMESTRNISDEREREQNPLRPDQLTPGARGKPKRQAARPDDGYQPPASGFGNQLPPSDLGWKGNLFGAMFDKKKEEQAKFTGEPTRNSLTEPPPGYQTPSPAQPYGLATGSAPAKAANDYQD
ncbi:MAG TPA: hypothetical protein VFN84_10040, partial [Pseudolabrys sp.]|nr:hypothetical protein [Pseudolabrys sp.]